LRKRGVVGASDGAEKPSEHCLTARMSGQMHPIGETVKSGTVGLPDLEIQGQEQCSLIVPTCGMSSTMARLARIVAPGCPHHVTARGNRREPIFFEDGDQDI
jgi:hypothetical protein